MKNKPINKDLKNSSRKKHLVPTHALIYDQTVSIITWNDIKQITSQEKTKSIK